MAPEAKTKASDQSAEEAAETKTAMADQIIDFLKTYKPDTHSPPPDLLDDRYQIHTDKPLPAFNNGTASAYEVTDRRDTARSLYAMVCSREIPYRAVVLDALKNFRHPNFVTVAGDGIIALTRIEGKRKVIIFEKPVGKKLSDILRERGSGLTEGIVVADILRPIVDVLTKFAELGIGHCNVNPGNIYLNGDRVILGECISEPAGYSQPLTYEPPERAQATPSGRGESGGLTDCYAVGVLALHLLTGKLPYEQSDKTAYLNTLFRLGPYYTLIGDSEFSDYIQDLLRGALNENRRERWTTSQLSQWVEGKRYNLIPPSHPREASRPFIFRDKDYFNRKALAHAFYEHWEDASDVMREQKLAKWVELSIHKVDSAEVINRIWRGIGTDFTGPPKLKNELVARTVVALDPFGPLRMRTVATNTDGIGCALADYMRSKSQNELQFLYSIIENDLPNFRLDLQEMIATSQVSNVLLLLQRIRMLARINSLGFGIERCLYDLNPALACQSPLVINEHATNVSELLRALDRQSPAHYENTMPMDRHIAAFLTSKLEIAKEIRLNELSRFPKLVNHPKMATLKLLSQAQDKLGIHGLKGLSHWMALQLLPQLDFIHRTSSRTRMEVEIRRAARTGDLSHIREVLCDVNMILTDTNDFNKARGLYQFNEQRLALFRNDAQRRIHARSVGRKIAIWISYILFLLSLMITLIYNGVI